MAVALALEAARELKTRLLGLYPHRILGVRLFGSMARGDAHEESDIDILVLVDRRDPALWRRIVEVACDVSDDMDLRPVSATVMEATHLADLQRRELLFALEVEREGIEV